MRGNVVALMGGLGNQLFQVAFGRWLEQRTGTPTWYETSFHRDLALDVLAVRGVGGEVRNRLLTTTRWWPAPDGRIGAAGRMTRALIGPRRIVRDYTGPGPDVPGDCEAAWWFGYWQRREYADMLVPELSAALAAEGVRPPCPLIGVHVRRGDMMGTSSAVPDDWFARGLERLREHDGMAKALPIRVWSDDPDWCRSELDLGAPFQVAAGASPVEHLAALASCSALVLSRSTFSWWAGAVASKRGAQVVFPAPWWVDAPQKLTVPTSWLPLATNSELDEAALNRA